MLTQPRFAIRLLAGVLLTVLGATSAWAQAPMKLPQIWTGRMLVPEGVEPGLTGDSFELRIFQTSTDEEAAGLVAALQTGGQEGLRNAMYQLKVKGWVRIGKLAATDAVFIRVMDLPDGQRRVRFYSDHPLRLYDKSDPAGSNAHPFAFLELLADASGKGNGSLIAAASLSVGDDGLRMESAGVPVIRVYSVETDSPPAEPKPAATAAPAQP